MRLVKWWLLPLRLASVTSQLPLVIVSISTSDRERSVVCCDDTAGMNRENSLMKRNVNFQTILLTDQVLVLTLRTRDGKWDFSQAKLEKYDWGRFISIWWKNVLVTWRWYMFYEKCETLNHDWNAKFTVKHTAISYWQDRREGTFLLRTVVQLCIADTRTHVEMFNLNRGSWWADKKNHCKLFVRPFSWSSPFDSQSNTDVKEDICGTRGQTFPPHPPQFVKLCLRPSNVTHISKMQCTPDNRRIVTIGAKVFRNLKEIPGLLSEWVPVIWSIFIQF